jgi:uncharacterized OB-fold protein
MRLVPEPIEELNKQYWQHCANRCLCFQRCKGCNAWRHIPRPMCASCNSMEWEWAESKGRGKVFSWTVTHAPFHKLLVSIVPYAVVIVQLDEGVKMVSGIRNLPIDKLELDLPVEVLFEQVSEEMVVPYFQPLQNANE